MIRQDVYERILTSLYDAMLDDTHWPATSALIDEACGITSNCLLVGEGPPDDLRVLTVGLYYRGQRHEDLEREYLEVYHPIDERIPRFRQLPDSHLVHVKDLYTAEELKTSPTYNEILLRSQYQNGLNVRLDGPDTSHISWGLGDPVASDGWGSSEIATIKRLLPHIRQFIRVRQALVRAEAHETTVTALLDNPRIGVLHLDRRGQIIAVNDRARSILRHGDGLSDRDGVLLGARKADDQLRLEGLVACRTTGRRRHRSQRVDAAGPLVRVTAIRGARQTRRCSPTGLRSAARRRAGPDCRAGEPASDRPRLGGQDPGADADGEPGGGRVGRRKVRGRNGGSHGEHEARRLLAPAADLPEAVHLAAGRTGTVGAIAGRSWMIPAPRAPSP